MGEAEEVERRLDALHVAVLDPEALGGQAAHEGVGVASVERRLEVPHVPEGLPAAGRVAILLRVAGRREGGHRVGVADPGLRPLGANRATGVAERQVHDVAGAQHGVGLASARSVSTPAVAGEREDVRLVEHDPVADAVAERAHDDPCVLREAIGRLARGPAARVLERLGQVPVVERHEGPDARGEQSVDHSAVVVEALRVRGALTRGLDARPGDREAVAGEVHGLEQLDVLAPAVIGIAGDVTRVAVLDLARRAGEAVPDRLAPAVLPGGAFDLVRGGRGSPAEAAREDDTARRLRGHVASERGRGARHAAEQARPGEGQRLAQEQTAILAVPMVHQLSSSRRRSPHHTSSEAA